MDEITTQLAHLSTPIWYQLGAYQADLDAALQELHGKKAVERIWGRDGGLWTDDPVEAVEMESRLGWLDLPSSMRANIPRLRELVKEVLAEGFARVVLLGMGGSSLAPEVMAHILGVRPGYLPLTILDSTDPAQIRQVAAAGPLARTLFLVSSKSGATAEVDTLYAYFRAALVAEVGEAAWAKHFVAITDPGTRLDALRCGGGLRAVFLNPADIGGRYSALSLFGLLPAALMGADLDRLLRSAKAMAWACRPTAPEVDNSSLVLGAILGACARHAPLPCNKLTLLASSELARFGTWVEQLIAESTGKHGVGIVPVESEPAFPAGDYGPDRVFVYLRLDGAANAQNDARVASLVQAGHPVVALRLKERYDLGAEFWRWEFATAVAGACLGINPFDQPDVESAKIQAREALKQYEETHALPEEAASLVEGGLSLYGALGAPSLRQGLGAFLAQARPGDYVALMAYIERNPANEALLQEMRRALGAHLHVPITVGFGPRFLHSTGQLHKGGPDAALFLQITQDEAEDLAIPERAYTFGVLKRAQALGDLQALRAANRRAVRVNLGCDIGAGLAAVQAALPKV